MKPRALQFFPAVMVIFCLASCGGKSESSGGGNGSGGGKDLVIALDVAPTNLDSRVGNDLSSAKLFDLIYTPLIRFGNNGGYEPDLATSWDTPDDKTIVFHIRPGVKFHDGRPVTAKDVKFTYDSLMAESFQTAKKSGYAALASIEVPDEKTVIFHFKEPNAGIFDNLNVGIVPQGADTNVFKTRPIGSGPYRVTNFLQDDRVEMEAYPGYYGGTPKIQHVIARVIPDATTRVLELKKGSVNFVMNSIPFDTVNQLKNDKNFTILRGPGSTYGYLCFNLKDPVLQRKEVRQAIAHAIDRGKIVDNLILGYGKVTNSLFPPGHWARAENLPDFNYDPANAKKMLDAAGFPDPDGAGSRSRFKLNYRTSTDAESNQQAEIIQQMLKQVGVDLEIQSNEFAVFYDDIQKGKFQLFSLRRAGVSDPDFYYTIFDSKSLPPDGQNRGYYINPKVDALIEQGRSTFDKEKRKQAYVQVQQILAEDLPYVSLYHRDNVAIMKSNVHGFEMGLRGYFPSVWKMTIN
ncbi:MAG TPA: ABC transporter substrate-binding protein [Thermoanaerobaculia bacterium]|nr:ABC transporter substrate-binding protein [Thermoanaerobaculia bacterium]